MNTKAKKRLIVVSGIIVIVLVVLLAVVGGNTTARAISVAEAVSGSVNGQKVQVSGNVVQNSFSTDNSVLTFSIYDTDNRTGEPLVVRYEGAASSTFGNDVTAICTGRIGDDGVLQASELVTKCPSKYENATDALTIARLLAYDDQIWDKPVKVCGAVVEGTLNPAGTDERFRLIDPESNEVLSVAYDGALPDAVVDGAAVVLTGSFGSDDMFTATDVALGG